MTLLFLLLHFLICAGLIACAGYVLSRSADRIAKATGLSGGWIGLALLGTTTSLPGLASGITSVARVDAASLWVESRPQGRVLRVFSWVSVGMLAIYVLNATLVFLMGT
jgi:Sodium/calcium exchanger protein